MLFEYAGAVGIVSRSVNRSTPDALLFFVAQYTERERAVLPNVT